MKKIIGIIGTACMLFSLTACESPQQRQYNYENTPHEEESDPGNKQYVTFLTNGITIEIESFSGYANSERVQIKFKNPEVFYRTIRNAEGFNEDVAFTTTEIVTSFQNVIIFDECTDIPSGVAE